jgi:FixJ family two-component response regulator
MSADGTRADEVLPLLLVTSDDQHEKSLRAIFDGTSHATYRVLSCSEALRLLDDLRPGVVLVEADLPTGNWKRLLDRALNLPHSPQLIVFSCFADDRLWAEVLDLGGYDVLATPFETEEVLRTVSSASDARARKLAAKSGKSTAAA